jgi:hypothetical protein
MPVIGVGIVARVSGRQLLLHDSPTARHSRGRTAVDSRTAADSVELGFAQRLDFIVLRIRCHGILQFAGTTTAPLSSPSPAQDHFVIVAALSLYSRAAAVMRITFLAILVGIIARCARLRMQRLCHR